MKKLLLTCAAAALCAPLPAMAQYALRGELALEARGFPREPLDPRQTDEDVSLRLEPEFSVEWSGDTSLVFTPFGRIDSADAERTHADIRELFLRHRAEQFEGRVGIRQVFWGATESVHLVDIINQTDLVENPDGEDKLGQPMLNLAWASDGSTVDLFLLPYFRERTFPGVKGRLRPVVPLPFPGPPAFVSNSEADYESGDKEQHVDWAARYAYSGDFDLALSHFSGTARAPSFRRVVNTSEGAALVPFYAQIEQTGLDATYVAGGWLYKLEAIRQRNDLTTYAAAAGGFEYTVTGILGSVADLGLLAEYLWDERGSNAGVLFNNDLFVGTRLAGNDEASTELLAGVIVDLDTQAHFVNVEGARRLSSEWKLVLEARLFENAPETDPAYSFRRDDYLSLELIRYF